MTGIVLVQVGLLLIILIIVVALALSCRRYTSIFGWGEHKGGDPAATCCSS